MATLVKLDRFAMKSPIGSTISEKSENALRHVTKCLDLVIWTFVYLAICGNAAQPLIPVTRTLV
jgi:hypothetical protein